MIPNTCLQGLVSLPLHFKEVPIKERKLLLAGLKQVEALQELSFRQEICRKGAITCTEPGWRDRAEPDADKYWVGSGIGSEAG